jgi:Holliday junction resolvasome RuvABC endonuclease subunit
MGISQTAGAVMAFLAEQSIPVELVNVKHWKKELIGNGNASKEDIAMWLSSTHPVYSAQCDDQDQRDATCVALYGWQILRTVEAGVLRDEVSDPR